MPFTKADLPPLEEIVEAEPPEEIVDEETSPPEATDPPAPQTTAEGQPPARGESIAEPPPSDGSGESVSPDEAHAELIDKAKQWDAWMDRFARNPQAFIRTFAQHMSAQEKVQLAQELQQATQPPPAPFESQSPGEEWLVAHTRNIEAIPQIVSDFQGALVERDRFLYENTVQVAALEAKIDALEKLLNVTLPALDQAALQKALDGKTTIKDAVKRIYTPAAERAIQHKQQAEKERPRTPGNAANSVPNVKGLKDMNAIMRQIVLPNG